MTTRATSVWRESLGLLRVRFALAQLGLVAGVFALFVLWLRLPDANVLEVVSSAALALLVVGGASVGESKILLDLAACPDTRRRLARGALAVLAGTILWFVWSALVAHWSVADPLRAGYLNSRASYHWRRVLTFEHVVVWLGWMWSILQWIGSGLIAVLVFTFVAGENPLRAIAAVLRTASLWLLLLFGTPVAILFTGGLLAWLPLHGLWAEIFSLGVRLAIVVLFDGVLGCWFLALLAVCVRRVNSGYAASSGTP